MLKTLMAACIVAFGSASIASAATYQVDGLLHNYGASLIHDQDYNGDMSGSAIVWFDSAVEAGGVWEDDGDISFAGTLEGGAYSYTAMGNIDTNGGGYLDFVFDGGYGAFGYTFSYDGNLSMGVYNSYADGVISLWGDTGQCSAQYDYVCLGMDLRIAVSEIPSEVPLPASALLLLGGMGAFAGLRRKQKAA